MKEEIEWFRPEEFLPKVDYYQVSDLILIQTDTHVFEGRLKKHIGDTYFTDDRESEDSLDLRYTLFEGKFRSFEYEKGERIWEKHFVIAWANMPRGIKL